MAKAPGARREAISTFGSFMAVSLLLIGFFLQGARRFLLCALNRFGAMLQPSKQLFACAVPSAEVASVTQGRDQINRLHWSEHHLHIRSFRCYAARNTSVTHPPSSLAGA